MTLEFPFFSPVWFLLIKKPDSVKKIFTYFYGVYKWDLSTGNPCKHKGLWLGMGAIGHNIYYATL